MITRTINFTSAVLLLIGFLAACSPTFQRNQIDFGIKAAQRDLWDEAIFRWTKALASDPDSAAALNNLAVAYEKKGDWEAAEKSYQRALEIDPDNERIQSNFEKFKNNLKIEESEKKKEDSDEKKK